MTFHESLESRRKALRISQPSMAMLLDVSPFTYQKWEQGRRTPNAYTQRGVLERIAFIESQQGSADAPSCTLHS